MRCCCRRWRAKRLSARLLRCVKLGISEKRKWTGRGLDQASAAKKKITALCAAACAAAYLP